MQDELTQYYRSAHSPVSLSVAGHLSGEAGYFRFGPDTICYGQSSAGHVRKSPGQDLYDASKDVVFEKHSEVQLPFNPSQVATNLRYERYINGQNSGGKSFFRKTVRNAYYFARPLLSVSFRKHLQKFHLSGWQDIAFPKWPVDTTVDNLFQRLMALCIRCRGGERVPFIWFWPHGATAGAIMTHDVEAEDGVTLCRMLMDMNQSFNVPASFQVVPEERYKVQSSFLNELRTRGFEVNVHDLSHDGQLFEDWEEFRRRAEKINQYGREFGSVGFRAAVMYRNQEWYDLLDFQYDMSVPSVAHLDPQRGGCCTVMPYFVGHMVELPLTMTQDYTLFNILNDYSLSLWEKQVEIILQKHGLISAIIHPDYVAGERERETYRGLLGIYQRLREEQNVWIALPKEVAAWWRQRSQMQLIERDGGWHIEGPGSERATLAWASLVDGKLSYELDRTPKPALNSSVSGLTSRDNGDCLEPQPRLM